MKYWSVPVLVAVLTFATAQADNDRGQGQGQGQGQQGQNKQGQGQQGQGQGQDQDKLNHGQVVSECNHRANDRNLKGQDRKDFTEWCESRGGRYGYDDNRYSRERDCYRNADKSGLSGDKRQRFLGQCFDERDRDKDEDKGKQYHPKVSGAVENSQRD